MANVFFSPVDWSWLVVGTWPRFWFVAVSLTVFLWLAVCSATDPQWRGASWALGLFLTAYQWMLLYALRRLATALKQLAPTTAPLA